VQVAIAQVAFPHSRPVRLVIGIVISVNEPDAIRDASQFDVERSYRFHVTDQDNGARV
jgi:hypothetical protein